MFRKRIPPPTMPPGTFVHDETALPSKVRLIRYSAEHVEEREVTNVDALPDLVRHEGVSWVLVQGLGTTSLLERIADRFSLHHLAVADVVNIPQRPKAEPYENDLFIVARVATLAGADLATEQVSLFVGANYVLTFEESYQDALAPLRERLRRPADAIRRSGADYLAYAVLDAVIDRFYPILEQLGERVNDLEDEALDGRGRETLRNVNRIRRALLGVHRVLWPQREALAALLRRETPMVGEGVQPYLRDCQDHCTQLIEITESYRELLGAIASSYLSSVGNRTNEIMRVLTVIASLFIPLTFLVGVYGMNFEQMPELRFRYGYLMLWIVMIAIGGGMLGYFRRLGWLGRPRKEEEERG